MSLSKTNTKRTLVRTIEGKWGYTVYTVAGRSMEYTIGTAEFELQQILDNMNYPQYHKEKLIEAIENYLTERSIEEARNNDESGSI